MEQLLQATTAALTADEAATRDVHQRTELADALRLLREHAPTLVKAYPMALLEVFAEGPAPAKSMPATATGMDFGELSLMDDAQVQAQVEFSRAQQLAVHATDATLGVKHAGDGPADAARRTGNQRRTVGKIEHDGLIS